MVLEGGQALRLRDFEYWAYALQGRSSVHVGNCQNYGPFLGPYYNRGPNTGPNLGDPTRDHNFDNSSCT